jgi:hypothetical protein
MVSQHRLSAHFLNQRPGFLGLRALIEHIAKQDHTICFGLNQQLLKFIGTRVHITNE